MSYYSDSSASDGEQDRFMFTHDHRAMVVYVHGSCKRNGQNGSRAGKCKLLSMFRECLTHRSPFPGIGVYWGPGNSFNVSEPLYSRPYTSNRAVLVAARRAIKLAKKLSIKNSLIIRSNSQYLVNTMNDYVHSYVTNGFRRKNGRPAKNAYDIGELYEESYKDTVNVQFQFRPGHDSLTRASSLSRSGKYGKRH